MGLFLDLSGIAGTSSEEVKECLQDIANNNSGTFKQAPADSDILDVLGISGAPGNKISIVYPSTDFMEWDEVSQELSKALRKSVFSFHIHDGGFWMYRFFVYGEEGDRFNPVPEYWGDVPQEESEIWAGNAPFIAKHWPDIEEKDIKNYLIHWELDDLSNPSRKAYPDDQYRIGEDSQLCDFFRRLGLIYPVDEQVNKLGDKFLFSLSNLQKNPEISKGCITTKPWWKFWK